MKRILRDGDTYKAFVCKNEKLTEFVKSAAEKLKPFGACNFQLRLKEDGTPYIFEINARCSGTTQCRTLAGFNEPLMAASWLLEGKKLDYEIKDIAILRYWNELVVMPESIAAVKNTGCLEGLSSRL